MKKIILLFLLNALIIPDYIFTQNFDKSKLDSLFTLLEESSKAMGSIAMMKNGSIIYSKAIGFSDFPNSGSVKADTNTKYRIGSITKMFTAAMIFQLIEEGKLMLNSPLSDFFPSMPNSDKIKIKNLLNHSSGLHSFTSDSEYLTWNTQAKSRTEMLKIMETKSPDFEPGANTDYSNTNYVLLGFIIEDILGVDYKTVLQQRINSHLDLKSTYYGGKINVTENESQSFKYLNEWQKENETDMSIPHGAGAIVSTPSELNKFINGLFSYELISKESLDSMLIFSGSFGLGVFKFSYDDKTAYGHNGGIDGFVSGLRYFPSDSLAVAYCSNGHVYSAVEILKGALDIYFNKPFEFPSFSTLSLTTEELDKYIGVYSSEQLPLKITISKNNTILIAQATNQPEIVLEATGEDIFSFLPAGIIMEFNTEKGEFVLKQGGGVFLFTREK